MLIFLSTYFLKFDYTLFKQGECSIKFLLSLKFSIVPLKSRIKMFRLDCAHLHIQLVILASHRCQDQFNNSL